MHSARHRGRLLMPAVALAVTASGLAACTTMTPYQPAVRGQHPGGGFSEQALGEARYRVTFRGNSLTARDRVEGYLLYRAAELTVRDGYDWFLILDRLTERDSRTYAAPGLYEPWYGNGYARWRPWWRYSRRGAWGSWYPGRSPFWAETLDLRTIERFEAHAEIVLRLGPVPAGEERAVDARQVMRDLGPTIERLGGQP